MLPSLVQDALRKVLGYCDASAVVNYGAASKAAAATAADDVVWRAAASRDFYADPPQLVTLEEAYSGGNSLFGAAGAPAAPEGPVDAIFADAADVRTPCDRVGPCDSWRAAYRRWFGVARRVHYETRINFSRVQDPFDARAWKEICRAWRDIKATLSQSHPAIVASLRPPASVEDLQRVHVRGLRYAYAIHDGQELAYDIALRNNDLPGMFDAGPTKFHGLFGGTTHSSTRFLSIGDIERFREEELAAFYQEHGDSDDWDSEDDDLANQRHDIEGGFWFARDQFEGKRFFVDVCLGFARMNTPGYNFCAPFPETVYAFERDGVALSAAPDGHNSFAAWFSTYAARLRGGVYRVAPILARHPRVSLGISLFPDADGGPDCRLSEGITNGIRVRASVAYESHERRHVYAIRIRRVSDDAPERCQLRSHRFTIRSHSETTSTESGDALDGESPILTRDGFISSRPNSFRPETRGEFIYYGSVSVSANTWLRSVRGELEFVPGSLASPTGPPFRVVFPELVTGELDFMYS